MSAPDPKRTWLASAWKPDVDSKWRVQLTPRMERIDTGVMVVAGRVGGSWDGAGLP